MDVLLTNVISSQSEIVLLGKSSEFSNLTKILDGLNIRFTAQVTLDVELDAGKTIVVQNREDWKEATESGIFKNVFSCDALCDIIAHQLQWNSENVFGTSLSGRVFKLVSFGGIQATALCIELIKENNGMMAGNSACGGGPVTGVIVGLPKTANQLRQLMRIKEDLRDTTIYLNAEGKEHVYNIDDFTREPFLRPLDLFSFHFHGNVEDDKLHETISNLGGRLVPRFASVSETCCIVLVSHTVRANNGADNLYNKNKNILVFASWIEELIDASSSCSVAHHLYGTEELPASTGSCINKDVRVCGMKAKGAEQKCAELVGSNGGKIVSEGEKYDFAVCDNVVVKAMERSVTRYCIREINETKGPHVCLVHHFVLTKGHERLLRGETFCLVMDDEMSSYMAMLIECHGGSIINGDIADCYDDLKLITDGETGVGDWIELCSEIDVYTYDYILARVREDDQKLLDQFKFSNSDRVPFWWNITIQKSSDEKTYTTPPDFTNVNFTSPTTVISSDITSTCVLDYIATTLCIKMGIVQMDEFFHPTTTPSIFDEGFGLVATTCDLSAKTALNGAYCFSSGESSTRWCDNLVELVSTIFNAVGQPTVVMPEATVLIGKGSDAVQKGFSVTTFDYTGKTYATFCLYSSAIFGFQDALLPSKMSTFQIAVICNEVCVCDSRDEITKLCANYKAKFFHSTGVVDIMEAGYTLVINCNKSGYNIWARPLGSLCIRVGELEISIIDHLIRECDCTFSSDAHQIAVYCEDCAPSDIELDKLFVTSENCACGSDKPKFITAALVD